ncbi:unnamed protein product, partial [marine sediment metagenome]
AASREPNKAMHAIIDPMLKVPTSPGNILAGYLLKMKNGINTAIATIEKMMASAEFHNIPHINREQTAIKHVPEPSPLYPSNMLTIFANTATINGIVKGYKRVNRSFPKTGIVGDEIWIKPK